MEPEGDVGPAGAQLVWKVDLAGVLQRVDIVNCGPAMALHLWVRESTAMLEADKAEQYVPSVLPAFGAADCPVSHLWTVCMEGSEHTALPRWKGPLAALHCSGR